MPGGQQQFNLSDLQQLAPPQMMQTMPPAGLSPPLYMGGQLAGAQAAPNVVPTLPQPPSPIFGDFTPNDPQQGYSELPIKFELDLSDEKSLSNFIYRQKYNMKKNDCFNLERQKADLEKDVQAKEQEIKRLQGLNSRYK